MRLLIGVIVSTLALGGVARAQSATSDKGYIEGVGQSAFGNVTSQSFGVEGGFTVRPRLQVFVEAGKTRDAAPTGLGTAAQAMAGALSQSLSNVAFTVKEPVTFFDAGIRYALTPPGQGRVQPYVMGGAGVASMTKNVAFLVAGSDVTSSLSQAPYYITLGSDLTGSSTKAMIVGGGGAMIGLYKQLVFDIQVRIGYILAEDEAITIGRVGAGIGFRF